MMKCFDARNNRGKRLWIERKDIHLIVHRALELLIWSRILIVINFLEILNAVINLHCIVSVVNTPL